MGTGGALFQLRKKVKDFILVNGDTVFDINLDNFIKSLKGSKIGCVALTPNNRNIYNYKLNNLNIKNNSLIYKKNSKLMNGGVYFFRKKLLSNLQNKSMSLENELLPNLLKKEN